MKTEFITHLIRENPKPLFDDIGIELSTKFSHQIIVLCPLHNDRNPSLSINLDKCVWHCFAGCGGGSLIRLYSEVKNFKANSDYPRVLNDILKLYGVGNGN